MIHLYKNSNPAFVNKKIREIKVALFKADVNSELQLPNNIIEVLEVNDDGSVQFLTSCGGCLSKNNQKSFHAYLDFFQKSSGFRMQISGEAVIKEYENDLFLFNIDNNKTNWRLVLIKIKIDQAQYHGDKLITAITWKEKLKSIFNWLPTNPQKGYSLS